MGERRGGFVRAGFRRAGTGSSSGGGNIPDQTIEGNNTGAPGPAIALTAAQVRTLLGLAAIATSGSASDIGSGTLAAARIADASLALAKLANIPDQTILGNNIGVGGPPIALTAGQLKTILGITTIVTSFNSATGAVTYNPITRVANVTALAALSSTLAAGYDSGSLAYVDTVADPWELQQSALAVDNITVVTASGRAGFQWVRKWGNNLKWQAQLTWSVDPSNSTAAASDENTGINDAAPLLTHAECARRTWGAIVPNGASMIVRHLSSDLAGAAATYNVTGQGNAAGTDASQIDVVSSHFSIVGIPTVTYTGTVAGAVSTAAGAVGDNNFTDAGRPAFANTTGVLWVRSSGTKIGFWPMKDLGANAMRHSCGTRTYNRLTLVNGDTWQIWTLPILRNVMFFTPGLADFDTAIHNCDVRMTTLSGNGPGGFWHCDLTASISVAVLYGRTAFGNCRNPFELTSTAAANPITKVGGGLVDAASQTLPASGQYFGAPSSSYLSFQGRGFSLDHGTLVSEGQFMFYDAADCLTAANAMSRCELLSIGGSGNTGKLVKNQGPAAVVVVGTFGAGATSDGSPFQLNAATSTTPALVDVAVNFNAIISTAGTALKGAPATANAVLKFSGTHLGAVGAHTSFLADQGTVSGVVELATGPGYPLPAHTVLNLRVDPISNNLAVAAAVTVFKNGVATAITVSVPAGSTALISDLTHSVAFAAGDEIDVQVTATAGGAGNILSLSCTIEMQ